MIYKIVEYKKSQNDWVIRKTRYYTQKVRFDKMVEKLQKPPYNCYQFEAFEAENPKWVKKPI